MLDLIEQYWYVPAGLMAILIILVVLRFVRARQEDEFDRSLGRLQPSFETSATEGVRASDTYRCAHCRRRVRRIHIGSRRPGRTSSPISTRPAVSAAATGQHVAIDDTVTGERPVALDQGDPLAEADFHMAYGLYDQAADLVQIAISREPNRRELKLKLLEVFFVWGNKDRFLQTARELASSRAPGAGRRMGKDGDHGAPDRARGSVVRQCRHARRRGQRRRRSESRRRAEPRRFRSAWRALGRRRGAETGAGLDLDLGAALGDGDITGEVNKVGDDGVDFVLDDPERGNDATGSTREMPGACAKRAKCRQSGRSRYRDGQGIHRDDARQMASRPRRGPDGRAAAIARRRQSTIREKIDAAARAGMRASDQTAELALDDLGLDLGALEGVGDETGIRQCSRCTDDAVGSG